MGLGFFSWTSKCFAPPHPTWQSEMSRNRVRRFLKNEQARSPGGLKLNVGSGSRRFEEETLNIDLFASEEVDIQGDLLSLPIKEKSVDSVLCTGVLEHVPYPDAAVTEILRVLKPGGRVFFEVPFMQTLHATPSDFCRWTPDGLRQLLCAFRILELHVVAGPASALAWLFQETMALLFSLRSKLIYKIGLRVFGYMAKPISLLDLLLERHPMAWHAASGFAALAVKHPISDKPEEKNAEH